MSSPAPASTPMITATDHGAIVSIAVYFLMTTFIVAVLIRLTIRLAITRSLGWDDYLSVGATAVGIGQSIAVLRAVDDGLGKKEYTLSRVQVMDVQKAQYASDILYLATICLAKRFTIATAGAVGVWAVVGIVVLAAQCGSSNPWALSPPKCINVKSYWIGMAVFDVITELVIVIIPGFMMIPVQVAMSKKAVIIAAFIFRVLSIAATVTRLFYIHPATARVPDVTLDAVNYNIVTQCVLSIGVTTACIPCLKPFLDGFDSGFMAISFKDRMPGGSHSHSRNMEYRMGDLAYAHTEPTSKSNMDVRATRPPKYEKDNISRSEGSDYDAPNKMGVSVQVIADGQSHEQRTPRHSRGGGSGSVASSSKSNQMIIKKNVQYTVQYEDAGPVRGNDRSRSRRHSAQMRDDKSDLESSLVHAVSPGGRPGYAI